MQLSFSGQNNFNTINVFRPIQYLGTKLRSLAFIVNTTLEIKPTPKCVFDIFSGTTVVSQALAFAGFRVISTDAMLFSSVFGRALLGIQRPETDIDIDYLINIITLPIDTELSLSLEPWLSMEVEALERRDSNGLFEVSRKIPQIWRPNNASALQKYYFEALNNSLDRPAFDVGGIVSSYYAGTYFGAKQAIQIDQIRVQIEELRKKKVIGPWENDLLLTTLLSIVSDSVFSAGKHFAQPHLIRDGKDLSFLRKRILQDRSINIWKSFTERLRTVSQYALPSNSNHLSFQTTLEDLIENNGNQLPSIDLRLM